MYIQLIDWEILIILASMVILLARVEKKFYGTWNTPFNILAIPYFIVVLLVFSFAKKLNFIPLYMESVIIWIFGLFFFWLGSLLTKIITGNKISVFLRRKRTHKYLNAEKIPLLLSWIAILIMGHGLLDIYKREGLLYLSSEDFQKDFGLGWYGSARVISMFFLSYFVGIVDRNKLRVKITILAICLLLLVYQVKGILFLPIIAGLIFRSITGELNFKVPKLILLAFSSFLIFMTSYLIGYTGLENRSEVFVDLKIYAHLTRHFVAYLFSGILALGDAIESGLNIPDDMQIIIISPIRNFVGRFLGWQRISNLTDFSSSVDLSRLDVAPNVHTLFGTLYLFAGSYFAIAYTILMSLVIYSMFSLAAFFKNVWLIITYSFIVSALMLGWFEFYYWHAFFFEIFILGLFMFFLDFLSQKRTGPEPDSGSVTLSL